MLPLVVFSSLLTFVIAAPASQGQAAPLARRFVTDGANVYKADVSQPTVAKRAVAVATNLANYIPSYPAGSCMSLSPNASSNSYITQRNTYQLGCRYDLAYIGDIGNVVSPNYQSCFSLCDAKAGCNGFSYWGGKCWFKNLSSNKLNPSTNPSANLAWIPSKVGFKWVVPAGTGSCQNLQGQAGGYSVKNVNGVQYNIQCGSDMTGLGDIGRHSSPNFASCLAMCDATNGCSGVTWGSNSICWFKKLSGLPNLPNGNVNGDFAWIPSKAGIQPPKPSSSSTITNKAATSSIAGTSTKASSSVATTSSGSPPNSVISTPTSVGSSVPVTSSPSTAISSPSTTLSTAASSTDSLIPYLLKVSSTTFQNQYLYPVNTTNNATIYGVTSDQTQASPFFLDPSSGLLYVGPAPMSPVGTAYGDSTLIGSGLVSAATIPTGYEQILCGVGSGNAFTCLSLTNNFNTFAYCDWAGDAIVVFDNAQDATDSCGVGSVLTFTAESS